MELQARFGRLPRRLGREMLRHVGLGPAGPSRIEELARAEAHEVRGFELDVGFGDRELHALVLADGPAEDDALARVFRDLLDEPVAVADAFRRDDGALGVQAVEDVAEAPALLADAVLHWNLEILDEELVGLVVDHVGDGAHLEPLADRLAQVHEEDRHAVGFLRRFRERGRPREQDHEVRMLHAGDPHLLTIHDVALALLRGEGPDRRRVRPRSGLGHRHRLQAQLSLRDLRKVPALLLLGAVPDERAHVVHLPMARARVAAAAIDFLHHHGGFRKAEPRTSVFLRNQRREPSGARERGDEFLWIAAAFVDLAEIRRGKLRAQVAHSLADVRVAFVERRHVRDPQSAYTPALRISGVHLSISAFSQSRRPAGVCLSSETICAPSSAKRFETSGSLSALRSAALSLSSASFGVPFGAYTPCHTTISKSLRPCSSSVGASGSALMRSFVVTP